MKVVAGPCTLFAFDLDDTLFKEIDFVRSGFRAVVDVYPPELRAAARAALASAFESSPVGVFDSVERSIGGVVSAETMLAVYRTHTPTIELAEGALSLIRNLRAVGTFLAVITDGRSVTQRNKLAALGIPDAFDEVVISEEIGSSKPSREAFLAAQSSRAFDHMYYLADNPAKDFLGPNDLGWATLMLADDGRNIHRQDMGLGPRHRPRYVISDFSDLKIEREERLTS